MVDRRRRQRRKQRPRRRWQSRRVSTKSGRWRAKKCRQVLMKRCIVMDRWGRRLGSARGAGGGGSWLESAFIACPRARARGEGGGRAEIERETGAVAVRGLVAPNEDVYVYIYTLVNTLVYTLVHTSIPNGRGEEAVLSRSSGRATPAAGLDLCSRSRCSGRGCHPSGWLAGWLAGLAGTGLTPRTSWAGLDWVGPTVLETAWRATIDPG